MRRRWRLEGEVYCFVFLYISTEIFSPSCGVVNTAQITFICVSATNIGDLAEMFGVPQSAALLRPIIPYRIMLEDQKSCVHILKYNIGAVCDHVP